MGSGTSGVSLSETISLPQDPSDHPHREHYRTRQSRTEALAWTSSINYDIKHRMGQ